MTIQTITNHSISKANFKTAIQLGYYEVIQNTSFTHKIVKHYKACGRTQILLVEIY